MEQNILKSTKKVLGVHPDDPAFDLDLMMHVNAVFSTLQQLGVGPAEGFMIEDGDEEWGAFLDNTVLLNQSKIYMFLSIKIIFDPPASSFALDALKDQREEKAWRLQVEAEDQRSREDELLNAGHIILDGGGA